MRNGNLLKSRVSEIHVKQVWVNQGVGVCNSYELASLALIVSINIYSIRSNQYYIINNDAITFHCIKPNHFSNLNTDLTQSFKKAQVTTF